VRQLPVLWAQRDFRWLFLSQAISTTGDRLVTVALALLVTQRTGSTTDLGLVIGAQTAALVIFLLIGGAWADRLPRHRIMVSTDLVRCLLHAGLAVLIFADGLQLWHLIAIEVVFGAAEAFFRPAYSGLVPQTVPEELIQEANALNSATLTIAEFVGPAIATGLVLTVGTGAAFAVDAGTFLLSALLLTLVRPRTRGAAMAAGTSLLREIADGYREVRARPWVWVTILVFSFKLLVGFGPYLVLGPAVAGDRYDDADLYGWVVVAVGVGTFAGALIALRWRPLHPLRAAMLVTLPFSLLLLAFAFGAPLALVLALGTVAGAGSTLFSVWWETALAQRIPPEALSRVTAYDWMGSLALLPVGFVLVGTLAEQFSATTVMAIGGVLSALLVVPGLLPRETRELRRLDEQPAAAAPAPLVHVEPVP
jgi:MFS family permease